MAWFLLKECLTITYSWLWKFLNFLVFLLESTPFQRTRLGHITAQLYQRPRVRDLAKELLAARQLHQDCVVFFCSSAGEYEQARPVIDRLLAEPHQRFLVAVFFYSISGVTFARARPEAQKTSLSLNLAPLTDSPWDWGWIFAVLRPAMTTVVRHEIWPGFLATAAAYGPVTMIGASVQSVDSTSAKILKKWLYSYFTKIYCLSQKDYASLTNLYGVTAQALMVAGDTKYDRVAQRSQGNEGVAKAWVQNLTTHGRIPPYSKILVAGSIYPRDTEILLDSYLKILNRGRPREDLWNLVLVPHKIDGPSIQEIADLCLGRGFQPVLTSQRSRGVDSQDELYKESGEKDLMGDHPKLPAVIIVDQMGFLAEIYGVGHAAYVGGALHHQVHNVLEPAIKGLSLAWGPRYTNSQEAEFLVNLKLAQVVTSAESLYNWWDSLDKSRLQRNHNQILDAMTSMLGATSRILKDWQKISNSFKDLD